MIPIYEEERDYQRLADVHQDMGKSCGQIVSVTESGKRYLGTYFRVSFYGIVTLIAPPTHHRTGDLFEADGLRDETYVYKEPAITQLPEVCQRLRVIMAVTHLLDSRNVDPV